MCANASKHNRCSSTQLLKALLMTCMLISGGSKRKSSTKTDGFLTLGLVHLATRPLSHLPPCVLLPLSWSSLDPSAQSNKGRVTYRRLLSVLGCRYCHLYSSVIPLSLTQLQSNTPPSLTLSVSLSLLLIQSSMKVQRVPGDCSNSQKDEEREGDEQGRQQHCACIASSFS